jgi:hypothetical protein
MTMARQPFKALPFIFIGLIPLFYLEAEVRKNHPQSSRLPFFAYTFSHYFSSIVAPFIGYGMHPQRVL